jgi:hypothetical protein
MHNIASNGIFIGFGIELVNFGQILSFLPVNLEGL